MSLHLNLELKPSVEATQKKQDITEEAAVSRLRPIKDAKDSWEALIQGHGSSADTGSGGPAPG
jgi:hypothetical protein